MVLTGRAFTGRVGATRRVRLSVRDVRDLGGLRSLCDRRPLHVGRSRRFDEGAGHVLEREGSDDAAMVMRAWIALVAVVLSASTASACSHDADSDAGKCDRALQQPRRPATASKRCTRSPAKSRT